AIGPNMRDHNVFEFANFQDAWDALAGVTTLALEPKVQEEAKAAVRELMPKEYISETIDDPEAIYDPEIWDTPGFTLVLSWLAQKWHQKCHMLAHRRSKNPEQYLTKEQQKACLDSAAVEYRCRAGNGPARRTGLVGGR